MDAVGCMKAGVAGRNEPGDLQVVDTRILRGECRDPRFELDILVLAVIDKRVDAGAVQIADVDDPGSSGAELANGCCQTDSNQSLFA